MHLAFFFLIFQMWLVQFFLHKMASSTCHDVTFILLSFYSFVSSRYSAIHLTEMCAQEPWYFVEAFLIFRGLNYLINTCPNLFFECLRKRVFSQQELWQLLLRKVLETKKKKKKISGAKRLHKISNMTPCKTFCQVNFCALDRFHRDFNYTFDFIFFCLKSLVQKKNGN